MAGKGGGAWKVAYADFVTAMMAFFMVMWLTSQSDEVKHAVAEHFRNPTGKNISGTESRSVLPNSNVGDGNRRASKSRGNQKSESFNDRQMTDEGDRSNVGKVVNFDLNSMDLSNAAKAELDAFIPQLDGPQFRIEVRGHSANNGSSANRSAMDAWSISFKRAMAVTQYLIEQGVDPRRIRPSAAGFSEPKIRDGKADLKADSRVEVFVLKELFEDPSSISNRQTANKSLDIEAERLTKLQEAETQTAKSSNTH